MVIGVVADLFLVETVTLVDAATTAIFGEEIVNSLCGIVLVPASP